MRVNYTVTNVELKHVNSLQLSGKCKYILAYDGHVIAISDNGNIQVLDYAGADMPYSIAAGGRIHSEPAIRDGVLYVGFSKNEKEDKGGIAAYYLGDLSLSSPEIQTNWVLDCDGIPIQALLPFENRLYLKLNLYESNQRVSYVDQINQKKTAMVELPSQYQTVSTLASTSQFKQVFFLSEDNDRVYLNVFDHNLDDSQAKSTVVEGIPKGLVAHIPIASMGSKIFAVFDKDNNYLCRLDAAESKFDQILYGNVKEFSMRSMNEIVIQNNTGIFFTLRNTQETFVADDSTSLPPIILKGFAAVIGLRKGKIRLYNISNPIEHVDLKVFESPMDEVTAMAAFENYIAVGNQNGIVNIFRLIEKNNR